MVNFPQGQPNMHGPDNSAADKAKAESEKTEYKKKLHSGLYSSLKNPKPRGEISQSSRERMGGDIGNDEELIPVDKKVDDLKNIIIPKKPD